MFLFEAWWAQNSRILLNSEKKKDRLDSLKIIEKRYSFLFEDAWFILIQYLYFEKFIMTNTAYLGLKALRVEKDWRGILDEMSDGMSNELSHEFYNFMKNENMKQFGFMFFNSIFTALIGLDGLTTIGYSFKMIKQGKTKTKVFYLLTFIQTLLQTTFPFMRVLVILHIDVEYSKQPCILVGFQVYPFVKMNLTCGLIKIYAYVISV